LIAAGEVGQLYYAYAQRVNLGKVRKDENALWSFAPHDISVILYLFDAFPESIVACGESYLQPGIDDVVFVNMHFPDKRMAQVQVSWLDPRKLRQLTLVGDKKMIVFDDVESTEKIKIYDKGAYPDGHYNSYGDAITIRFGDIYIPRVAMTEPLRLECQHFVECIMQNRVPLTDGKSGLEVVKILEAAQESLNKKGQPVKF
jgi:predicted dehydrogenase